MAREWSEPRSYRHLDRPISPQFVANVQSPDFVARHSFSPLIGFEKISRRYKPKQNKTVVKTRPIMFASHRDAAIFGYYATQLSNRLEDCYRREGLESNVLAYRRLGRGNDSFSAEVYRYAADHAPCVILAFDVENFFGSLDHKFLKNELRNLLGEKKLPADWYQVFKAITKYHFVRRDDLKADPIIGPRFASAHRGPIATIAEAKLRGITIYGPEKAGAGIPQGTPISAVLSNLYMLEFDREMARLAHAGGALYRRYSDDILVVCPTDKAAEFESAVGRLISSRQLVLNEAKSEKVLFDPDAPVGQSVAQYLGFSLSPSGASLRPGTISRRWRKLRGALRRARKSAAKTVENGSTPKISTKKLRRQFTPMGPRNFSTYARRASKAFPSSAAIIRQIQRLERKADAEISKLKAECSVYVAPKT